LDLFLHLSSAIANFPFLLEPLQSQLCSASLKRLGDSFACTSSSLFADLTCRSRTRTSLAVVSIENLQQNVQIREAPWQPDSISSSFGGTMTTHGQESSRSLFTTVTSHQEEPMKHSRGLHDFPSSQSQTSSMVLQ
jgi:hypothetical protein